jgi:hypothetical protein
MNLLSVLTLALGAKDSSTLPHFRAVVQICLNPQAEDRSMTACRFGGFAGGKQSDDVVWTNQEAWLWVARAVYSHATCPN